MVTVLAPIVGAVLISRGRLAAGGWPVVLSGLAALAFEGRYHFVVNPDHVSAVTSGRGLFATTAALSIAGDAMLVTTSG